MNLPVGFKKKRDTLQNHLNRYTRMNQILYHLKFHSQPFLSEFTHAETNNSIQKKPSTYKCIRKKGSMAKINHG